jgi:hypothetical protein
VEGELQYQTDQQRTEAIGPALIFKWHLAIDHLATLSTAVILDKPFCHEN